MSAIMFMDARQSVDVGRISRVVPGQDSHHRSHLHPPLLLRPPVHKIGIVNQILDRGERVRSAAKSKQHRAVWAVGDNLALGIKISLSHFHHPIGGL